MFPWTVQDNSSQLLRPSVHSNVCRLSQLLQANKACTLLSDRVVPWCLLLDSCCGCSLDVVSSCSVWSDLVWSGLSGLVWSGLVWSGLVWSGLVWSGLMAEDASMTHCNIEWPLAL